MDKLIDNILATEYEEEDTIIFYSHTTDKSLYETLAELFENNTLGIKDWDIDGSTLFDGPSYTTGYVVAAWVEDGALHTYHIVWEME